MTKPKLKAVKPITQTPRATHVDFGTVLEANGLVFPVSSISFKHALGQHPETGEQIMVVTVSIEGTVGVRQKQSNIIKPDMSVALN